MRISEWRSDVCSSYLSLITRLVDDVAARHEVSVDVHGGFARPPKPLDAKAEGLFRLVRACGLELGLDIAWRATGGVCDGNNIAALGVPVVDTMRSEEHTSELQSLMRNSYAVFCLTKKQKSIAVRHKKKET